MLLKYLLVSVVVLAAPIVGHHHHHGGRRFRTKQLPRQQNQGGGRNAQRPPGNDNNNNNNKNNNNGNPDSSLCLDPSVVQKALLSNGLGGGGNASGEAPSLTSSNNFINFCAGQTLTNGAQVLDGSCNPTPMGQIAAAAKQPAVKFLSPKNFDVIPANKAFDIQMSVVNIKAGFFTNATSTYFLAPQQVDEDGIIQGHSHITVQEIPSLDSTDVPDPTKFAFFKGIDAGAVNGVLTANVANGLPAGIYRASSITTSSNHAPVLTAKAQKGSTEDSIYFTVSDDAKAESSGLDKGAAASAAGGAAAGGAAAGGAAAQQAAGNGQKGDNSQQGAADKGAADKAAADKGQQGAGKGQGGKGQAGKGQQAQQQAAGKGQQANGQQANGQQKGAGKGQQDNAQQQAAGGQQANDQQKGAGKGKQANAQQQGAGKSQQGKGADNGQKQASAGNGKGAGNQ